VRAEERGVQRVAILGVEFEGNVPDAVRELFQDRLAEGLVTAKFEVFPKPAVERRLRDQAAGLKTCRDGACFPDVARALGVGYLVTGRVVESSKTYGIVLDIVNGRTGGIVANSRERCETCGIEEVAEKMALAASALRTRLEALTREPARAIVRSKPAGARVTLDGRVLGVTPLDVEIPGGEHHLALELAGHDPSDRTFTVVSGVDETLDFDLVPLPSAFPFRAAGWTSVATGVVAMAAGLWALSMEGQEVACSEEQKDPKRNCPLVYRTKTGGAALIGIGAAAASIGGVLLYFGSAGPGAGGRAAFVGIRGRL
jgi:TolB-like protein